MTIASKTASAATLDGPKPVSSPDPLVLRKATVGRSPLALLLSMAALVSCSLELELLEQIDSLRLYMTFKEILLDASVALLILLGLVLLAWMCLLFLAKVMDLISRVHERASSAFWGLGLTIPLSYFVISFIKATKLRFSPHWTWGLAVWIWLGPLLLLGCAILVTTRLREMQAFCRTRLVPIGGFHFVLAVLSIAALRVHDVYIFHDFVNPAAQVVPSGKPDIYLITIDALRADEMSLYGYPRPTTPNLQQFADEAFIFDFFFANSNFTTSGTTSIETGKLPWTDRVFQLGGFLRGSAQSENLGALLRQQGYYTSVVSANPAATPIQHRTLNSYDAVEYLAPKEAIPVFSRVTNLVGLNCLWTLQSSLLQSLISVRMYLNELVWNDTFPSPAEQTFERSRNLLANNTSAQPRFLWTHIFPPHDPYLVPPPYRGQFLPSSKLTRGYNFIDFSNVALPSGITTEDMRARYDEDIAYVDHAVGDFLRWLNETGRLNRSIVIISSDHGESFEHGWYKHTGPYLYNGLIRIPLLIHLPGQKQGSRISVPGEQVDLLPTIMDLVGGKAPAWSEGTSLLPALQNKPLPQRPLFSMNLETDSVFQPIKQGTVAVIDGDWKFIERLGTGNPSLYHYKTDPFEKEDVLSSQPLIAAQMRDLLANKLLEVNSRPQPVH